MAGFVPSSTLTRPALRPVAPAAVRSLATGLYEVGEVMYFFNPHFGLGLRVRDAQIRSTGLSPDAVVSNAYLGTKYRDQFLQIGGVISIKGGKSRN